MFDEHRRSVAGAHRQTITAVNWRAVNTGAIMRARTDQRERPYGDPQAGETVL
jgi:hypothetical protein